MTKTVLANQVGVSLSAVIQWEDGDTTPTTPNLEAIAKALGVSLAEFWGEPPARKAS